MGDLGVFEAMANASKVSAAAEAEQGNKLERDIDRAIFRAKERFSAFLANAQSRPELEQRWTQIKPEVMKVIAEVTTPTPGVVQKVGRALNPSLSSRAVARKARPSSAKVEGTEKQRREAANAHRDDVVPGSGVAIQPWIKDPRERKAFEKDMKVALASDKIEMLQKTAWAYDQETKLWTSKDPMQKFACPGCGTEQAQLGFTHCAGCERTWNSWPVRQASSGKTSAATYVLMAREIKMRGDQFRMAAAGNVAPPKAEAVEIEKVAAAPAEKPVVKTADGPQEPPPGMSQPGPGAMPGDNSMAMGAPVPPEQPPTPMNAAAGDADQDGDLAGGITEDSPIDQIQDVLQDAIGALKGVQSLSINPALTTMASTRTEKVAALRNAMDRFWALHKQMNYVAGMLAKEATEAIRAVDPRITGEAEFVKGFTAASKNEPLPAKTARAWLEGYIAFHKQASDYSTGADIGKLTEPTGQDESTGVRNDGSYLNETLVPANEIRGDAGPYDSSQPAQQQSARDIDADNAAGASRGDKGQSSTIQPTGARRALPKGKR